MKTYNALVTMMILTIYVLSIIYITVNVSKPTDTEQVHGHISIVSAEIYNKKHIPTPTPIHETQYGRYIIPNSYLLK